MVGRHPLEVVIGVRIPVRQQIYTSLVDVYFVIYKTGFEWRSQARDDLGEPGSTNFPAGKNWLITNNAQF